MDMKDRVCIVTGANAGIGKVTALELARQGATVVMLCRSPERGAAARQEVLDACGHQDVELMQGDLSSQESIHRFAEAFKARYDRLDVLVNNAGGFFNQRQTTVDGLELTFALNHLGYFLPTLLLLDRLQAVASARVVNVSSDAHRGAKMNFDDLMGEKRYRGFSAYGQSKLANILFTYELARRLPTATVTNFGRNNTGIVGSAIGALAGLFGRNAEEGAETSVYLASSPEVEGVTAKYFTDKKAVKSSDESYRRDAAEQLWTVSEELTGTRGVLPAGLAA
jgi:NAD(P)-dependent dehydrogenase (short-subunit alcohol dehydrogenase family)